MERTYVAIDLKSFYASVEARERAAFTASVRDWYAILCGETRTVSYGDGNTLELSCSETGYPLSRPDILAALENAVLLRGDVYPLSQGCARLLRGGHCGLLSRGGSLRGGHSALCRLGNRRFRRRCLRCGRLLTHPAARQAQRRTQEKYRDPNSFIHCSYLFYTVITGAVWSSNCSCASNTCRIRV